MAGTPLLIGWVRDLPKLSADQQVAALVAHGIAVRDVVVDGRKLPSGLRMNWGWLMRKLRSGDTLAVTRLRALYTPRAKLTPRKSLFRTLHEIEDAGVEIIETATGRRSTNARQRDMMIADCLDAIARSRVGGDSGRPKREPYSAAELALVEQHWPNQRRHTTNKAAVDAIHEVARERGFTRLLDLRSPQAFINVFGASGRGRPKRKS
jgi:hypothetical protein